MKKIVFLSLVALCLPWGLMAQGVVDDLYYVPSKKEKAEQKKDTRETVVVTDADQVVVKSQAPQTVRATAGTTTVVVRDTKGRTLDVDAYNRRYDAKDYDFTAQGDTLYIDEQVDDGLDGEWVGGFDGSAEDYEYATRIIRFRNPRYAIPVSSPLYFDVVYGLNTWDWNVYYDGFYAYAFPTFTNRLWWDWRFNSFGWWGYPYYGWSWGWHGWYDPWYHGGWAWHHPHWHHPWHPGPGWGAPHHWGNAYTARRSFGVRGGGGRASLPRRSTSVINGGSSRRTSTVRRASASGTTRRVVGTRNTTVNRRGTAATRSGVSSSTRRTGTYTRPGGSTTTTIRRGSSTGVRRSTQTYNRGSSSQVRRNNYNYDGNARSTTRSRSYGTPSRSGGSRSSISTSGGSFRSSGGVRSGGGSRSGGGARRR